MLDISNPAAILTSFSSSMILAYKVGGVAYGAKKVMDFLDRNKMREQLWKDWCQHVRVQGQQGAGKSTLLLHMIKKHMNDGRSVIVLDPHGTLARAAIRQVPKEKMHLAVYHRPASVPLGMNVLKMAKGTDEEKEIITDNFLSLLRVITYAWGPIQDHMLEQSMYSVLDKKNPNIYDLIEEAAKISFGNSGIEARLGRLTTGRILPLMMTSDPIPFEKIMDKGGLYFLDLSGCGTRTVNILYRLHLLRIMQACMVRTEKSKGVFLVCDEAQRVANTAQSLGSMLTELRKYSVSVCLAHHDTSQMNKELTDLYDLIANQYLFNLTTKDAKSSQEIASPIEWQKLTKLPNYQCLVRRKVRNRYEAPKIIKTQGPPPNILGKEDVMKIAKDSFKKYGAKGVTKDDFGPRHPGAGVHSKAKSGDDSSNSPKILSKLQDGSSASQDSGEPKTPEKVSGPDGNKLGVRILSVR